MRRNPALAILSRDHHQALVVAQRLQRAAPPTIADAIESLRAYWERHGRDHFAAEEQVLLPRLAQDAHHEHPVVAQVLLDHLVLRHRAEPLLESRAPADCLEAAHALGAALAEHVRREERVLFPLIEHALTPDQLVEVGEELEHAALRLAVPGDPTTLGAPEELSFGPLPGPGDSDGG